LTAPAPLDIVDVVTARYEHPYPSAATAAEHPFDVLDFRRYPHSEMIDRASGFHAELDRRRSVRMLSDEPVPRELIEYAIRSASTAPSGAHQQPWTFVVTGDLEVKREIRSAAEAEERINYDEHRMNDDWQRALAPLGTDHHKEFLEIAPWLVVLFEQRYGVDADGSHRHHYYVKESVGIAAGMFVAALHHMGLATLTHTPTPMAFLSRILARPKSERPFVLFPIGYPAEGCRVPRLRRKSLDEVMVVVDEPSADR
jgi:iodotyrosine deiodinase